MLHTYQTMPQAHPFATGCQKFDYTFFELQKRNHASKHDGFILKQVKKTKVKDMLQDLHERKKKRSTRLDVLCSVTHV